ncbi:hypothetical protein P261_01897 [Lachnospiraceae bacterium TWA4]|nr:hypothetical protein P261_01897 [Lachnospiraceae bacterium TWA4]
MKKRLMYLISILLMVLLMSGNVLATNDIFYDSEISGDKDSTVFVAGDLVLGDAVVKGILFSAGNTLLVNGSSDYAMLAGNEVNVQGTIVNDVLAAGRTVNIQHIAKVQRDVFAVGQKVFITGEVGRNVNAAGSLVFIDGTIKGDVHVSAGEIQVGENAKIEGNFYYNADAVIDAPGEILNHAQTYESVNYVVNGSSANTILDTFLDGLFKFLGGLIIVLLLYFLTNLWEKVDVVYEEQGFSKYLKSFVLGLLPLIIMPILAAVLMIVRGGFYLGTVTLFLYFIVILISDIFMEFFIGRWVSRKLLKRPVCYWLELVIGILVWTAIGMIPVLDIIVYILAAPLGFGVVLSLLGKKKKIKSEKTLEKISEEKSRLEDW